MTGGLRTPERGLQKKYNIRTVLPSAEKSQRCQEPGNVRVIGDFNCLHTDRVAVTPHCLPKNNFLVAMNDYSI